MDHGKILEEGDHKSLLALGGNTPACSNCRPKPISSLHPDAGF